MIEYCQRHPFLRLLAPLVVGILCGDAFPSTVPLKVGTLACLLFAVLIICYYFYLRRWYGVGVCFFFWSLGYGLMSQQVGQTVFVFSNHPSIYKICIQEKPEIKERSILCRVVLLEEFRQDTILASSHASFLLYFSKDSAAESLKQGDELRIHTHLAPPANNGNPNEFDYVRYLKHRGITGTAYVPSGHWQIAGHNDSRTFRQRALECREQVLSLYRNLKFKGDELAVLSALTVGDKEELSDDIVETYSISGASHVLALSGLHIGFIYALFWFLFNPLWKRWKWLKPVLLLFVLGFLWSFAFLTGLSSSVVRSVIMFSLLALATLQPEKSLTMNTLAATAMFMLLYKPTWLYDVGFQLSFVAVAAILLIQPKLYALWHVKNRLLRYVWGLITVSVAAQVGTAPLVILYFSRFSTHFLLTNLWVIPLVSLILYSVVFLLLLTPFPFLQQAFATVVEALVHLQNEGLQWIEHLPFSSLNGIWMDAWEVLLYYLLLGLMGYTLMRRTSRNVCLSLSLLLLILSYHSVSIMLHTPQRSIVFYNVRHCPVVHCMAGGSKSWLACADSLPDISRLKRSLSPYWNRLHLDEPQLVTGDYLSEFFSMQNQILCYGGKNICLLHDARWKNKMAIHPIPVDYLYISKGYEGGVKELSSLFTIQTVVLDASLPTYDRENIINECIRLGISYLSLSEKGSVHILL